MKKLKAPFPYFGGKSKVAELVWSRLGDVKNYIEPFCGSAAMLLLRPHSPRIETINDIDCMVANFWRAVKADPDAVVEHCDWPVNEADLHARHRYLVLSDDAEAFRERIRSDPEYFDARMAGWWCWGACMWIGGGWCSWSNGPDRRPGLTEPHTYTGVHNIKQPKPRTDGHCAGVGVHRKRPSLGDCSGGDGGKGVHVKRPKLSSNGVGTGVHRGNPDHKQMPAIADGAASGVHAGSRIQLADEYGPGRGVHANGSAGTCGERRQWLNGWFGILQDRLRLVRVCSGRWKRVCGSRSTTTRIGLTGVFLDPPYSKETGRDTNLYASEDLEVAHEVREWCIEKGDDPKFHIALCGLDGEHNELESHGWDVVAWKSNGGYGNRGAKNKNRHRERIWFSPHCFPPEGDRHLFSSESAPTNQTELVQS